MNLPNKISIGRIILVPIFLLFLMYDFVPYSRVVSLIVFTLAAMSDSIDGYVARKYNLVTTMGKFLDPLADKLLIAAALIGLVQLGLCNVWFAVIIIAREFIVTSLRIVAISKSVVIAASSWGKIKTTMQILAIIIVIIADYVSAPFEIGVYVLLAATLVTAYSGYDYLKNNWSVIGESK
ncbi:MAG: CDP-diacylglycerol--glycerol-3-phosphate 3-phosphatidyltransferase [Bacillota bacterium]|nr:CDP-diacylglycerol--glycerol-3-phosphate 3-phosphatidyltransferase [Bacillota bacterium]